MQRDLVLVEKRRCSTRPRCDHQHAEQRQDGQEEPNLRGAAKAAGFSTVGLTGKLEVSLDALSLDPAGLQNWEAKIQLSNGRLAEGKLEVSGTILTTAQGPEAVLDLAAQDLSLERLLPVTQPEAPHLQGRLSAPVRIQYQSKPGAPVTESFSGAGTLTLVEGRLRNINLLKEVFQRMTVVPGLNERLLGRLPETYLKKFEVKDTLLKPMQLNLRLDQGVLQLPDLKVATDDFQLEGKGIVRLSDARIEMPATFRIEPELSGAILRSVEELKGITDPIAREEMLREALEIVGEESIEGNKFFLSMIFIGLVQH